MPLRYVEQAPRVCVIFPFGKFTLSLASLPSRHLRCQPPPCGAIRATGWRRFVPSDGSHSFRSPLVPIILSSFKDLIKISSFPLRFDFLSRLSCAVIQKSKPFVDRERSDRARPVSSKEHLGERTWKSTAASKSSTSEY